MKLKKDKKCLDNSKFRIVVLGQHEVGKSALTVRYLTKRFIGEYKSDTDLLYRQTMTVTHNISLDIDIVDVSTCDESRTFADILRLQEFQRVDAFIIVYSVTDRSSFNYARETVSTLYKYQKQKQAHQHQRLKCQVSALCHPRQQQQTLQSQLSQSQSANADRPSKPPSIYLLGNKTDLRHMRAVHILEGFQVARQYKCTFYELSVAQNSPEVYKTFLMIIANFADQVMHHRKFSVSKMLGNFRIGRKSSCDKVLSQGSIIDTSESTIFPSSSSSSTGSSSSSTPTQSRSSSRSPSREENNHKNTDTDTDGNQEDSMINNVTISSKDAPVHNNNIVGCFNKICTRPESTSEAQSHHHLHSHNINSSICHLKDKLVGAYSLKRRQNSPPACTL